MCCCCCCCDCLLVIVSIFFPPLPVMIKRGLCSCDVLINICLCLLGYVPGLIHSWYIIARYPDIDRVLDDEERLISSPCNHPQTIIIHQPAPITFNNPEPFSDHPHGTHHQAPQRQLSPLSSSVHPNSNMRALESYGAIDGDDNNNNDNAPPPSYDNIMSETAKQYS